MCASRLNDARNSTALLCARTRNVRPEKTDSSFLCILVLNDEIYLKGRFQDSAEIHADACDSGQHHEIEMPEMLLAVEEELGSV
jgi:hypothetical protein